MLTLVILDLILTFPTASLPTNTEGTPSVSVTSVAPAATAPAVPLTAREKRLLAAKQQSAAIKTAPPPSPAIAAPTHSPTHASLLPPVAHNHTPTTATTSAATTANTEAPLTTAISHSKPSLAVVPDSLSVAPESLASPSAMQKGPKEKDDRRVSFGRNMVSRAQCLLFNDHGVVK